MFIPRSHRALYATLLPIPIVAAVAALLLLGGCGGPASQAAAAEEELGAVTTIRVHANAASLSLRGDQAPLSWTRGVAMTASGGGVFTYTTRALKQRTQLKPLLPGAVWSRGPNFAVDPGATVELWPRFQGDSGHVQRFDGWRSPSLQDARPVWIYTPPSYDEQPAERFPVVYMHDGQNLFDPAYSFSGATWQVAQAFDQGAADGSIREAVVVGIGNTSDRIWEYTPTDGGYGGGGASAYLGFVVNELKPQIDQSLRVSSDRLDTALVGSSLGGLVTACEGVWSPGTFGLLGIMSPSTWWDGTMIIGMVQGTASSPVKPARVYVDSGDAGGQDGQPGDDRDNTARLAQAYRDVGNIQVLHVVGHGDSHEEAAWARRLPGALRFLLGPRSALP